MVAQKPISTPIKAKPADADVMVVVPTAGRTLLPYPDTDEFRQCVPFARAVSGIDIRGDAWSWWGKATGRYERGHTPEIGAVMVLQRSRRTPVGHVSVVAEIQDSRHMLVTHANWGHDSSTRGMIHERQPVEDMSANNNWSIVKMWTPQAEFGSDYQTYGFIYNRPAQAGEAVSDPPVIEAAVASQEREPVRQERSVLVREASYRPEQKLRRVASEPVRERSGRAEGTRLVRESPRQSAGRDVPAHSAHLALPSAKPTVAKSAQAKSAGIEKDRRTHAG